jgi:hypothetical protein
MKTSRSKRRPKAYVCRKCPRNDFKTPMEFTNHLRNCRGPVAAAVLTDAPAAPAHGLRQELMRLRTLGIEVRDLADRLLKKVQ